MGITFGYPPGNTSNPQFGWMSELYNWLVSQECADGVNYRPSVLGTTIRTVQSRLRDSLNIKDFGALGDNSTNDYSAFSDAIAYVQSLGGGELYIPKGIYKLNTSLALDPISSVGWHDVILRGEGPGGTILDFSGCSAGSNGINITGWGGRFGLENFSVINAKAIGISINNGISIGNASWLSRFFLRNIVVDGSGTVGIKMTQTYMSDFYGVESRNSGTYGFHLEGYHTSSNFIRCWAGGDADYPDGGNNDAGWFLNGLIYCYFSSCSSDWNLKPGWVIRNVGGTIFDSCAAESNGEEGFLVQTTDTGRSDIPSVAQDIHGLVFDSCFAYNNSKDGDDNHANFLGVSTANSHNAQFTVKNCVDDNDDGTTISIVLNGTSGTVYFDELNNNFFGTFSTSGTVLRQNNTVEHRSALASLTGDQTVSDSSDEVLEIATLSTNNLGATISSNGIVIPSGVNRIRVVVGVYWDSNSTGIRLIRFRKNSNSYIGYPQLKSSPSGYTPQVLTSPIIEVVKDDVIDAVVYQSSGGNLNVINNGATFLSVEALG